MIIVQGKHLMTDWFPKELHPETYIMTSETGFTNNQIAIAFLKHFIKYTDTGEWKLLLMDNHGSHETPEFIQLANENHILPYPLLAHLTHCMQPLDVGCFQPYKHWHDVAVQNALAGLDVEYTLRSFLRDLEEIRAKTFKKDTIKHAFKKSGIYPPNTNQCLKQLRIFSSPEKLQSAEEDDDSLLSLPCPPQTLMEVDIQIDHWEIKFTEQCSSPSCPKWQAFVQGTKEVLTRSQLQENELRIHQKRRIEDQVRKITSRKRVQKFGGLTAKDAQCILDERKRKEEEKNAKRDKRAIAKAWRYERDLKRKEGVQARKEERERIKKIKQLIALKQDISPELLVSIPDPQKIWEAEQAELAKQEEENTQRLKNEEEITIITDTIGDSDLQLDYMSFPEVEMSLGSTDSDESEIYDSDNDYSWDRY